jgi:DNA-binding transcriptional regulator YiaG
VDEAAEEEENAEGAAWAQAVNDADTSSLTDADEKALRSPDVRRELRRSLGLTRNALSRLLGLPETQIERYESGAELDPLLGKRYRNWLIAAAGVANDVAAEAQPTEEVATQE